MANDVSNCSTITESTMNYLLNNNKYKKYLEKTAVAVKRDIKRDKKFYRRRIYDLTKQLLSNESPDRLTNDVKFAFDNYVLSCVNYFKNVDKTDIIQEDYADLEIDNNNEIDIDNMMIENIDDANQIMMRSIKIQNAPTLDNFVIVKNVKEKIKPVIPKKKEINLKDPILKNKGLRKKNNIINNYDNAEK